jgi:hypothetical protein
MTVPRTLAVAKNSHVQALVTALTLEMLVVLLTRKTKWSLVQYNHVVSFNYIICFLKEWEIRNLNYSGIMIYMNLKQFESETKVKGFSTLGSL